MPDVDHLYALPLEEFTPARDAAAKEIRRAGDRETAAMPRAWRVGGAPVGVAIDA